MTPRQAAILKALVELYAQTAEPVGSAALSEYFDVSSATIRAELVALEEAGLIVSPHTSAGRVPTDEGYRAYVNTLERVKADGRMSQVIAKRIQGAGETDRVVRRAAESLSEVTNNVGLATTTEGTYFTGLSSLFNQPEFFQRGPAYEIARLLDHLDEWLSEARPEGRINVYIGHENPVGKSSGASLIVARFATPYSDHAYVGVLGPTRQNYHRVMGLVDYAGRLLEETLA